MPRRITARPSGSRSASWSTCQCGGALLVHPASATAAQTMLRFEARRFTAEQRASTVRMVTAGSVAALSLAMTHDLTVRFYGVRGSIATPGLTAGGNTACVEVVAGATRIILDAGTGLRALGNERMASGIRHSTILLSHLHWDHVAGLQFFTPVYVPGHRVEIASGPNGVMSHDAAIRSLFKAPFFPVDFDDLGGTVATRNHPDPAYGYRLELAGQSIVYATDTEHFACVDPTLKKLAAGADILIYDAQYTPEEYPAKVGWGHSTWQAGAELARAAGVPQLVLFHHAPARTDAQLAARATLWLIDGATGEIRSRVATLPEMPELRVPPGTGVVGHVAQSGELVNIRDASADPRWAHALAQQLGYEVASLLNAPIVRREQIRGVLQVLTKREGHFSPRDEEFIRVLAEQIGRALDYTTLRGDDASRGLSVRGRFNHVIGRSPAMAAVYEMIVRAAQTDATVLLHGETGTGKGLLARAIHVNRDRRNAPFVHVDCTTLPAALVESELFGHERGAYTGADTRVIGKVEAANGGTLFLDEIGELPLPLQGKLLRFVQERQFERVGGRETLTADVRLVAATFRVLEAMASAGQFRSDLYFRLRVVEVLIPPLRARGEDAISDLVYHFVAQFSRRYRKGPLRLADSGRAALVASGWPGNVRELENTIERAVVLTPGPTIAAKDLALERRAPQPGDSQISLPAVQLPPDGITLPAGLSLEEAERRYARAVLDKEGGNQRAAARALGISRNKLARLLKS